MLKQSLNYAAVGIEMGVSVAIGIFAGKWADSHWGTAPVFFWVGVGIGFGAAAKAVVDAVKKAKRQMVDNGTEDTKKD
ncbi:MAG: AtpZ/AtpI family protein [Deltaproteobacteria bacterium]|nr:AtpZ/AtpI family protein [Deltaproteobacteria bacterium]